ncbi:uncharacterized protein LOC133190969 [Saccostrea echinata]|uniref:uncharacterized protein LOC133190969 n=1 Tax=Saccostrea echinata TaxID=191078 RepID=UPI002A82AA1F|nr:uncharacterized protein LOC133190969 [Saccostrea echinata]
MDVVQSKYWNDQIKSMVGPCMITFSIPLTIPGLTITLVAFSDEKSFPVYGPLHITGLIILVISVFLIVFGCILKFIWKPIILPDIERQLSPRQSFRSESFYRKEIERIQRENLKKEVTESKRKNSSTETGETVLCSQKDPEMVRSIDVSNSNESEIRYLEQDEVRYTKDDNLSAFPLQDYTFPSPRGGRLPPIETTDKVGVSRSRGPCSDNDGQGIYRESRSTGEMETCRKKKKRRKRHKKEDNEEEGVKRGDEMMDRTKKTAKEPQLPKLQKAREHLVDENASGESVKSSNCSLLNEETSDSIKKRKRRKKRKTLSAMRQESHDKSDTGGDQSNSRSKSFGSPVNDDVMNRNPSDSDSGHPVDSD